MDKQLEAQLRGKGLFPLELDPESQEMYRTLGIDPSKVETHYMPSTVETHYTPGTPQHIIARYKRIEANVRVLSEMESRDETGSPKYRSVEEAIKTDLYEIDHPTVEDVLFKMASESPTTGICGMRRDVPKIIYIL